MSSNPLIDLTGDAAPAEPSGRWRSPSTWSLRARLVAALIALLAVLGLVVGATTEVYLRSTLYHQLDVKVTEALHRTQGSFGYQPNGVYRDSRGRGPGSRGDDGGRGQTANTLGVAIPVSGPVVGGVLTAPDTFSLGIDPLSTEAAELLRTAPTDGRARTYDLDWLGDYRVAATRMQNDTIVVAGLPLAETQATLMKVAGAIGGATLLALLVAGFAGVVIVRRTLMPLSRVAATATRVAELKLDRGEVDLAQRVPAADTDPRTEVGQVGGALNRMLDHVGNALAARHASETQVRQFVADASHELRTPLAAIRGYAELSRRSMNARSELAGTAAACQECSRTPVPDEVAHVLSRVESEAARMTTLVEDLLLLARLDAGRPLAQAPVDLSVLVVNAVSDAHAAGPGHDWRLDLPEDPVMVVGDEARLHQVLANLLANARAHTPEGTTVTVGIGVAGRDALLRVRDAGPGIPAGLLPTVFERFARGDSSRSRAAGSTGLGLSIVHAVVTAHGGTVAVDSAPGHTEFTVRLPLAPEVRPPEPVHQDLAQVVQ
jgi:two-component system OmpR family sensor kinase